MAGFLNMIILLSSCCRLVVVLSFAVVFFFTIICSILSKSGFYTESDDPQEKVQSPITVSI